MLEISWRLRLAHGQTVDVEASSREKTGYLGENTVFIFYKYRKNTFHLAFSLFCVVVAVDFADHDAGIVAGEESVGALRRESRCCRSGSSPYRRQRRFQHISDNRRAEHRNNVPRKSFPDAHGQDRDSGFS